MQRMQQCNGNLSHIQISSFTFDVLAMVAIGKPAPKEILPTDFQQREQASDRKPLSEIIMEGQFREPSGN